MLDPRIYRTSLSVVAVAVIVVAFSLGNQASPLTATLTPDAFNGAAAYTTMASLAAQYPDRRPGSGDDGTVATYIQQSFAGGRAPGPAHRVQRADGRRPARDRNGHRHARRPQSRRDRDRRPPRLDPHGCGRGSIRNRGAARTRAGALRADPAALDRARFDERLDRRRRSGELARSLPHPVDAVIVLGDMAGTDVRTPIVVPWSDSTLVAPAAAAQHRRAGGRAADRAGGRRREYRRPVPAPGLPAGSLRAAAVRGQR